MPEIARGLTDRPEVDLPLLTFPTAGSAGVEIALTTRAGGVSEGPFESLNLSLAVGDDEAAVIENRRRVAAAAGWPTPHAALLKQVHGCEVIYAPVGAAGILGEGDALVTAEPGVVLGILTADCAPVLLAGGGRVGAAHAGWRGLVGGVVERTLERMGGADRAWIGPSIRACCYEVGPEVIEAFRKHSLPVVDERHVDPPGAAAEILHRAGVTEVEMAEQCTSSDRSFFSHRRDGITGRQGAFIWSM